MALGMTSFAFANTGVVNDTKLANKKEVKVEESIKVDAKDVKKLTCIWTGVITNSQGQVVYKMTKIVEYADGGSCNSFFSSNKALLNDIADNW